MATNDRQYCAHSPRGTQKEGEPLIDHANAVAAGTSKFAKEFGFEDLGEVAGLLHDIGKYQSSFQDKIQGKNNHCEHSICGAKEALTLLNPGKTVTIDTLNGEILSYIIAGHHSGLPDCGTDADNEYMPTLKARLRRTVEDYSAYENDIKIKNLTKNWAIDFNTYDGVEM
ncbi:MAG: CRISPR-associated endonuclease Cas3'', partial [Clostridiales bacterium]|nr:CRISPR-associated endonuclease Cas3'' [Clostridiales bacterium]